MINHRVQKYIEDHSLGDKYISHDLVPSFYLADEQTPVEQNRCAMACQGCGAVLLY